MRLAVGVLVGWTLFVWVGRVRNVLADPSMHGADRIGPLLLAGSFVLLAATVALALLVDRGATGGGGRVLRAAVAVLGAWTTVVWVLRATSIALGGRHPIGFVLVHVVLAVVSVTLAAWAARSVGLLGSRTANPAVGA